MMQLNEVISAFSPTDRQEIEKQAANIVAGNRKQFKGWSPRVVVVDEPEYTASYQVYDLGDGREMTFVHLDVYFMGPDVYKRLKRQWDLFRQHVPVVLYCIGNEDNEKFERFISYFGFHYLNDVKCTDEKTRRLFWSPR